MLSDRCTAQISHQQANAPLTRLCSFRRSGASGMSIAGERPGMGRGVLAGEPTACLHTHTHTHILHVQGRTSHQSVHVHVYYHGGVWLGITRCTTSQERSHTESACACTRVQPP